jgi:RNA polymerase-associated protein
LETILTGSGKDVEQARKSLRESLTSVAPIFDQKPFFLSDEFTLVDCATAALLWRLPAVGVELPSQAKALLEYGERMFDRESFRLSLTETEREMR